MKKNRKKRKFNILKFFLLCLFLYTVGFGVYNAMTLPIKHIRILNTTYLKDQDILREAKIDNYPSFILTSNLSIRNNLSKDPFIKKVTIKRKWFNQLYLYIDEYKILFYNRSLGQVVLENKKAVKCNTYDAPVLVNSVPANIYDKLIEQMTKVDKDILIKISEIEYRPNEVDKERFFLTMNDGNYVYLTLYTYSKINDYNKILPTLENKKGILYLDSGNYFEIIN